ncbi:hypothetical protein [Streptomyces lavenduligriseus]|uniref:Uncharacterized protein n=1 Tax=Streptomyces lavenduligriseus TaxID=67315 RepID=A0ABT0P335_9ACTN|nr:hypothetical protein [Streptomyces lavenduligriseus]MCL3998162.1 hypothetical protein [Streptomyces lavenduligriseus]
MFLALFSRRPAPAPVAPSAVEPEPWFETGETWTPEGVTVVERHWTQVHAVVLVYTAAQGYRHNVACLGCHFRTSATRRVGYDWLQLEDATAAATEHANTCRAIPRDIPARPDDDTVREHLRTWVTTSRTRVADEQIHLEKLDPLRLTIQRTTDWLEAALQQLAVDQPEILRTETSEPSDRVSYYARRLPQD